jgi:hypothetical protein
MVSTVMVVAVIPTSVACNWVLLQSVVEAVPVEPDELVAVVAAAEVLPPLLREQLLATTIPASSTDAHIHLLT